MPRYIDADSLYERLEGYFQMVEDYSNLDIQPWYIIGLRKVIDALKNEPTADVQEVRRGSWIELAKIKKDGEVRLVHYQCSLCGCFLSINTANFCPACGAKMDLERKDERVKEG